MKFCPNCGNMVADDAKFCFSCGKAFAETVPAPENAPAAEAPVAEAPAHEAPAEPIVIPAAPAVEAPASAPVQPTPVQQTKPVQPVQPKPAPVEPKKLLLSSFQYILLMLLFCIPVIGLVFLFIWGAGHPKNPSLKRFSGAMLILRLLFWILAIASGIAAFVLYGSELDSIARQAWPHVQALLELLPF